MPVHSDICSKNWTLGGWDKNDLGCFGKWCGKCNDNICNINSPENIKKFIKTFNNAWAFMNGNCYWFAKILSERFNGEIVYDEINNHFLCLINDALYDIRGNITSEYDEIPLLYWKELPFRDPLLYRTLLRDCVYKIGE